MAADVSSNLYDWSTTASSNQPDGTDSLTNLDDNLREIQSVLRGFLFHKGANIASAATPDPKIAGLFHEITGTTTITGFATASPGMWKIFKFAANPLVKNSTALSLPSGADIQCATGDYMLAYSRSSTGLWDVAFCQPIRRLKIGSFTRDISVASGTQAVTGIGFKPTLVEFMATLSGGWVSNATSKGWDDGTTSALDASSDTIFADTRLVGPDASIAIFQNSTTDYADAKITSLDASGFTLTWTKHGSPTGTATIFYKATA